MTNPRWSLVRAALLSLCFCVPPTLAQQGNEAESPILAEGRTQQQAQLPTEDSSVMAKMDQAQNLLQQGQYSAAASAYVAGAQMAKQPLRSQWAKVQAGICYKRAGQQDAAIAQFDNVASEGPGSWWAEEALYRKAELCFRAGRSQEAKAAIEYLRIGFSSPALLDVALDLKARLEGIPSERLAMIKTSEHDAFALLKQAEGKALQNSRKTGHLDFVNKQVCDEVLELTAGIARDYPDASAANWALILRADALLEAERCSEAQQVYTQVVEKAQSIAPHSPLIESAKAGISYSALSRARIASQNSERVRQMPESTVEAIRADCEFVIRMNQNPKHVARARVILAETEFLAGRPQVAESMAESLLAGTYANPKNLQRFPEQMLQLHLLIAQSAVKQGNIEKARLYCSKIRQLHSQLPKEAQERFNVQRVLKIVGND